ncbi:hypothetical protein [Pseudomonas sp. FP1742]|uniref:hypothetical protein n=1 Tax=Pseudomonas sp. FP1742 TaxID=2954079 RepID=UPI00273718CC|nr:hypothetical protein [Pseudomonas sp. FP1742]WLG48622.1 hypothetical protein PSH64_17960 [Pseudomonas sp. FP1742]
MRRLAFFVEGYSEMLFVERLVVAIAGKNEVRIEEIRIKGGKTVPKSIVTVKAADDDVGQQYYILIVDCGGDHQVRTRLQEEHQNLTDKGYEKIVCVRDVRPSFSRADIPKLYAGLRTGLNTDLTPVDFILSIMEVEAWFLAEFNHYEKIDPSLTPSMVASFLTFDPTTDDPTLRDEPAADLNNCYALVGQAYTKGDVTRTMDALDYAYVYTDLGDRIPEIKRLVAHVDLFLTPE